MVFLEARVLEVIELIDSEDISELTEQKKAFLIDELHMEEIGIEHLGRSEV